MMTSSDFWGARPGCSIVHPIELEDDLDHSPFLVISDDDSDDSVTVNGDRSPSPTHFVNDPPRDPRNTASHHIRSHERSVPIYKTSSGFHVAVGMTVELASTDDFLYVMEILEDTVAGTAQICGVLLRRASSMDGMLPKQANELCAILKVDDSNHEDPSLCDAPVTRDIADVRQIRAFILTNAAYPQYRDRRPRGDAHREVGDLVCRRKFVERVIVEGSSMRVKESSILDIREDECIELAGRRVSDVEQWCKWRGEDSLHLDPAKFTAATPHTYGDACAGAGGAAAGAMQAGLNIKILLDKWAPACDTLRRNFPSARVIEQEIHDYCKRAGIRKVDVLHISFPCQAFSPAHTRPGPNDDMNMYTSLALGDLLKKCRPRCVTLEQTSGILSHLKHRLWFNSLLSNFTACGYSVRWKIIKCDTLGCVQARRRLFMVASCPGEPLPPFPQPTHGVGPGLLPFVTIAERLALVPRYVEAHMQYKSDKPNSPPYDAHVPLARCITTDGGTSNLHPSGTRSFTIQELCLLAGFPPGHLFALVAYGDLKTLIGNAVPSCVMRAIFGEIITSMRAWEQKLMAYRREDYVVTLD